jgi:hypothetical protein
VRTDFLSGLEKYQMCEVRVQMTDLAPTFDDPFLLLVSPEQKKT